MALVPRALPRTGNLARLELVELSYAIFLAQRVLQQAEWLSASAVKAQAVEEFLALLFWVTPLARSFVVCEFHLEEKLDLMMNISPRAKRLSYGGIIFSVMVLLPFMQGAIPSFWCRALVGAAVADILILVFDKVFRDR
jgi:hypothetical protein